jgi:subtilisin-like proprotein convertase family protein
MQTLYNNVLRPTQERLKHTQNLVGWLHYITGLLVFFLLLAFQNAAAQKPSENDVFYYYPPTGKIELQTSTEKVLVKFKSEKNLSQVQSILSKEAQIAPPKDQMYFASLGVYVLDLQNIGQVSEVKSLVGNLNANPEIDFAYPFVRWQQGKVLQAPYNQILLGLKQVSDLPLLTDQLAKLNLQIVKQNAFNPKLYHLALTETSSGDVYDMANRLYETGLFAFAEPDFVKLNMIENLPTPALTPPPSPTDPLYNTQWALNNTGSNSTPAGTADADMDVPEAWPTTTGSSTIKIAIIDTGVDLVHPDLVGNLLAGFDATGQGTNGGPLGTGTNAHGTSCAGQVAAIGNSIGVIGIAYTSKIIPVRVFHNLSTTDSWLADGINWAWNNAGADVLSNSWGGGPPSSVIDAAIDGAVTSGRAGKGSVVLFSSGNDNSSVSYPASNSKVIAVGAMSMCDERKNPASCDGENWWGGNYGTNLDVSAPGVKIQTTDISGANGFESGDYIPDFNGTSSACPNAAGVMALILSVNPNLTQLQARSILEGTCDKTGGYTYNQNVAGQPHGSWSNDLGHGRVNAARAVAAAATPDDVDMDGYTVAQGDCNDFDASIHPNATEICDFLDNDCDGQTDEGFTIVTCYRDSDMDNFGNPAVSKQFCATCGAGYVLNNTDCNDNNNTVYPNALEICDLIDNDCNGSIDEGFDVDMDGYTVCAGDCNDNNPNVNPGKTEICNGIDDNCDGVVDFPALTTYASTDVPKAISNLGTSTVTSTLTISGVTGNILDLNVKDLKILHTWIGDLKATLTAPDGTIFTLFDQPGVPTSSGGCNQNHILATFDDAAILTAANFESTCNLSTSPVANPTTYAISGTYQPLNSLAPLIGTSPNGTWTLTVSDVFSGDGGSLTGWSLEIGLPSPTTTYYVDADGDTYGDPNNSIALSCTPTSGFVLNNADCNDQNAAIYPGSSYMHPVDIVPPTTCGGSDGSISLSGFAPNTLYSVSYTKGMTTVPAANFTSNGTGAIIIPNLSAGNYTNIVAASGTCSSNPASATLNDPVPPTASVGGNNGPICAGSNATFTVTGTSGATLTYTLTGLMGNQTLLLDGTNQTISANNAMANVTLTLVSVTKNNCNVTLMENSTVTVLNPAAPVATGATICAGGSTTLTATGCVGAGLVLKWYQTADNAEVTMPVSPMVTTQYYAKCEQTLNNVTCVSAASDNVTVAVLNPATPVASGATICAGGSTTLTATGCVGSGLVLKWYQTADNAAVTMPVSPTVTTQYYAKCEQTLNNVTCASAASGNVTVTVLNPAGSSCHRCERFVREAQPH